MTHTHHDIDHQIAKHAAEARAASDAECNRVLDALEAHMQRLTTEAGGPARLMAAFGPPVDLDMGRGVRAGVLSRRGETAPARPAATDLRVLLVSHQPGGEGTPMLVSVGVHRVVGLSPCGRYATTESTIPSSGSHRTILDATRAALERARGAATDGRRFTDPRAIAALEVAVATLAPEQARPPAPPPPPPAPPPPPDDLADAPW